MSPAVQGRTNAFYVISRAGDSITCRCCGFTSTDPTHIQQKYCPSCQIFHEDRWLMHRLSEGLDRQLPIRSQWREAQRARMNFSVAE